MHLKRQKTPKSWPIERKGTKYVVRGKSNMQKGVPILIVLRDILKITENRKEAKRALNSKKILLNGNLIKDERNTILLFDIITIIPTNKSYRLELTEKGKFILRDINEKEANYKISKIINKKILKGKKIQLNLYDGRNILSKENRNIEDSVLINLKEKKIEKDLPLIEKAKVIAIKGKHSGSTGIIEKIDKKNKSALIKINNKKVNILTKQIMVIENERE
jgi:small subunit ribosomal protein S4e